jgi:hypothetical protein
MGRKRVFLLIKPSTEKELEKHPLLKEMRRVKNFKFVWKFGNPEKTGV